MDNQNPECNLHVESQRNASLENELFKVPFINRLYKMGNLHLKEFLVKPAHFVKTAFVKPAHCSFWEDSSIFEDSFWENIFGKKLKMLRNKEKK